MNLKALPALLFRSRTSQEREDYVRDSLSSLAVTSRLSCLSSSHGLKTDPFPLRFHDQWQHPECKVIKWYNKIAPSTQIASIEHRKTLEAPFFHEFLLIHLTNGAVCRLERMGDGSRVDAVRRLGCTAHDIIQWFPAKQYPTSPLALQPSEVIIHVQFPRTFDLLDVLAVCYSIKNHRRASIYTLQRYNCYFLCNTILAILTRRVAEWETKLITAEIWPKLVDHVMEELPQKTYDDAFDYCGIGLCSLLEPDCPNLVDDVIGLLRSELKSGASRSVITGIADTLWNKNLQSAIEESLSGHIDAAAKTALRNGGTREIGLETLLGAGNDALYPDTELRDPVIQRALIKTKVSALVAFNKQAAVDSYRVYKMRQLENNKSSKLTELLATIISPVVIWWGLDMDVATKVPGAGDKIEMRSRVQFGVARVSVALSIGKYGVLTLLDDDFDAAWNENNDKENNSGLLVNFQLCQLPVIDTRRKALCVLHDMMTKAEWMYSLRFSFTRLLMEAVPRLDDPAVVRVLEPSRFSCTITDMHGHIQRRIREHAKRVEGYQLAAAQLVEEDIEREMNEIWKSLPDGFGGVKTEC